MQGSNCEKWTGRVSNTAGTKGLGVAQWNEQGNWGLTPPLPVNSNPGSMIDEKHNKRVFNVKNQPTHLHTITHW